MYICNIYHENGKNSLRKNMERLLLNNVKVGSISTYTQKRK